MKRFLSYKLIIAMLLAAVVFTSCEDEDTIRIPFDDIETVVNMRIQIDPDFQFFDATDVPNGKVVMDMFTENDNIQSVQFFADYFNFASDSTFDRTLVATVEGSQFGSEGIINDFEITSQNIADAFGFDLSIVGGGDRVDFVILTTLTDGRVFPDTVLSGTSFETLNVTPNILNNAATTSLTTSFTTFVACSVPQGFATGAYLLEQVGGPADPFFGASTYWATEEVNVVATSPIGRQFEGTYITFGGTSFDFLLVCDNILVSNGTGIGCGGPGLNQASTDPPSTYDETDDSVIIIDIIENADGGCGVPPAPSTLRLTKL